MPFVILANNLLIYHTVQNFGGFRTTRKISGKNVDGVSQ